MISRAIVGTLYYDFDRWFPQFRKRISTLENKTPAIANRLELMKFHFYLAGLLAELSHVLSFTSKYKIDSIRDDFDRNSKRAKELAEDILEMPGISKDQQAEAYFYLEPPKGMWELLNMGRVIFCLP